MSDIVERLRREQLLTPTVSDNVCREAANEIERLRQVESLLIDQVTEADNDLGESVAISEGLCDEIERLRAELVRLRALLRCTCDRCEP